MARPEVTVEGPRVLACGSREPHAPHAWSPFGYVCEGRGDWLLVETTVLKAGGRSYPGCHDWPRLERRRYQRW